MELAATLHQRAITHPTKAALITPTEELSYAQLFATAWDLAAKFAKPQQSASGLTQTHRIGLLAANPVTFMAGYYAGVLSGTSVVILDPVWPESRLQQVIDDLGLKEVICQEEFLALLTKVAPGVACYRVELNLKSASAQVPPERIDADRELMVIFTSGTTSKPKGICRSRSSWQASLRLGHRLMHAKSSQVTLIPGPLAHGLSLYAAVESVSTGGTALLTGRWDAAAVSELIQRQRCTRIVAVPSILQRVFAAHRDQLAGLQFVVSGGEVLPTVLRQSYESLELVQDVVEYYGTSEHSLIAYRNSADTLLPTAAGFTGRPFPEVTIQIHHPDPATGVGEIFVNSPLVAKKYHASSPETLRRKGAGISVQDHGRYTRGVLHMAGRAGGMMNLGGNNLYPSEVSEVLTNALGLGHVSLVQDKSRTGESRLVAFALDSELGERRDPRELLQLLESFLPTYKIPHEFVLLPFWPMTASGKIATSRLVATQSDTGSDRVILR